MDKGTELESQPTTGSTGPAHARLSTILASLALLTLGGILAYASLLQGSPNRTGLGGTLLANQVRSFLLRTSGFQSQLPQLPLPLDSKREQHTSRGAGVPVSVAAPSVTEDEPCKKLLWFTCMGGQTRADNSYTQLLQAALLSARQHAPSLVPVLVYAGQPNNLTAWFELHGGTVVFHTLSFLEEFRAEPNKTLRDALLRRQGVYLRLDVPLLVEELAHSGRLDTTNISTRLALYTDADVLFMGKPGQDLSTCSMPRPQLLMVSPQGRRGTPTNSGVLLFNVPAWRAELPRLVRFGREGRFDFPAHDQGLLLAYMREHNHSLVPLPDTLNWKGYWGPPPSEDLATIVHWHGPKPQRCLECFVKHRQSITSRNPGWDRVCRYCPLTYTLLFQRSPDGGEFYQRALQEYHRLQQLV